MQCFYIQVSLTFKKYDLKQQFSAKVTESKLIHLYISFIHYSNITYYTLIS